MLSGRVKAIANEIRGTLKENGVPYGYVSVTCHQVRTDNGIVEEIRIKLLKLKDNIFSNSSTCFILNLSVLFASLYSNPSPFANLPTPLTKLYNEKYKECTCIHCYFSLFFSSAAFAK